VHALLLFHRLIVRPLGRDLTRTVMAVLTVALGVAVVLAIELAGDAAAGSFRSSVETLSGREDFEVTAIGGVPGEIVGRLARLPYPLRVTPRIESAAVVRGLQRVVMLLGVDFLSTATAADTGRPPASPSPGAGSQPRFEADAVIVSSDLGRRAGEKITLVLGGKPRDFTVAGVIPDSQVGNLVVMDIAAADEALKRDGRVDRILVDVPSTPSLDEWRSRLAAALTDGVSLSARGAATTENRRMLTAFRWNLRVLSYVALIVGAFLIYNTISVSVVRRRAEIGAVRALGATRSAVMLAFVAEGCVLGLVGAVVGLPLARLMATGAVTLIGATVNALYVSSTPGSIALTWHSVLLALAIGVGVSALSALSPAREASLVSPVDAMARGRRDYVVRVHRWRDLSLAIAFGIAAALASRARPIGNVPVFGYLAAVLSVASCGLAIPALVSTLASRSSRLLGRLAGVEALLASRSLAASLRRTSVLVAALATAIAMTT
jgi:putative ABC transport system permease protein